MPGINLKVWPNGVLTDSTSTVSRSHDSQVVAALEEYLALIENGQEPGRSEFLERHRSIAGSLVKCLDDLDFMNNAAHEFFPAPEGSGPGVFPAHSDMLGEFRIIREIGRGGMGVVYEAEQLSLGRRVALKVLPSAASLDSRQCQRFQVEAQAAALLHHDHIVPIFGVGFDQGVHFFSMQLIDGPSLTQVIEEFKAGHLLKLDESPAALEGDKPLGTNPDRRSPPKSTVHSSMVRARCRKTASLGLQAAEALDHAHQVGVIHRDIKPSNLLVDSHGKLWVADFGLARLPHDSHDLTRTGDLIGTLRYMSPEQLRAERGGVDCATDIYSLGVTLYESITLRPAFDSRDRQELLRSILNDEPALPRIINPAIPRDLETIILKAMEKEPSARYGSAADFADDLKHFLADEPVRARRPGLVDRSVKWIRRHRTAVVISMTSLIVTLTAATLILWQAKRRTDANLESLRQALVGKRLGIEYSLGAFDQITRPRVSAAGARPGDKVETERILRWALSYYDRIPQVAEKDDMLQEAVARAHRQAGLCRMALGQSKGRDDYLQAIDIYEQLAAQNPERIWLRTGLIETLYEYSTMLTASEDRPVSEALFHGALDVAETLIGNEEANKHCFTMGLVGPFNDLAWDLVRRPRTPQAYALRAIRLTRQAIAWEPDQAACWRTLGVANYRMGKWAAAASALTRSKELNQSQDPVVAFFLAAITQHRGQSMEARRQFDDATRLMERSPGLTPDQQAENRLVQQEFSLVLSK